MATDKTPPRLALTVGVTGHRDLDAKICHNLRSRVRVTLEQIKDSVEEAATKWPDFYDGPAILWAVSPLAEGADRIFAEEALRLGYELECPLPFNREEYRNEFTAEASKRKFDELLGKAESRVFELDGSWADGPAAYETLGRLVLDQCDILLAIWDGTPAKGAGGTAEVVGEARRRRIPVVCLYPDSREPDTIFKAGSEGGDLATAARIDDAVRRILSPPADSPDSPSSLEDFLAPILDFVWRAFERAVTVGRRHSRTPAGACPEPRSTDVFEERFDEKFKFWDKQANRMAGLYRGAFLSIYVLGVCAVFLAIVGNAVPGWPPPVSEVIAMIAAILAVVLLRQRRWHLRTADYRYLAEQFRILHYSYPLGLSSRGRTLSAPYLHAEQPDSWMAWNWRAWVRQTQMPREKATAGYLEENAETIRNWVRGQKNYHERNAHNLKTIEHRLHRFCLIAVAGALAACVYHLACVWHCPWVSRWVVCETWEPRLLYFTAGLPAAAAAAHAISRQGEFGRLADRSESMAERLKSCLSDLEREGPLTAAHLRRQTEEVAQVLLDEVGDWQILYRKTPPPPPV
jgi:hypothetical protein